MNIQLWQEKSLKQLTKFDNLNYDVDPSLTE